MKNKAVHFLILVGAVFIFTGVSAAFFMFAEKEEMKAIVQFTDYYFIDGSLVSGNIILRALYDFSDEKIKITVRTKGAEEGVNYIWDGQKKIENYDINMGANEKNYINKNAIFRVAVEKSGNENRYISFIQE